MTNIRKPEFEDEDRPAGFQVRRARIGRQVGTEQIGCGLWEMPPGEAAYPYHFHYGDEELLIVLAGRPTVRTPEGTREVEEGEVLYFPVGESGAHQLSNRSDEPVTFLAISSQNRADVVGYPDTDKLGVLLRPAPRELNRRYFRNRDAIGYWDEEQPPA